MNEHTPTIFVTGSKGQLGLELQELSANFPQYHFLFVDIDQLDITEPEAVSTYFSEHRIDFCINCAAYTAVDKAETESDLAWRVNVKGAENLAINCQLVGVPIINLSSDYVYHSDQNTPFKETDATEPKGVYAKTKLEGDLITLKYEGMVIRTSWLYSTFGNNFVKTMLRLAAECNDINVIYDQIGTPTYADDLAKILLYITKGYFDGEFGKNQLTGIYHYSNEGVCSWYDFAIEILGMANKPNKVIPIPTDQYPTAAKRPPFSVLDKSKIKKTFSLDIPHWKQSLRICMSKLVSQ